MNQLRQSTLLSFVAMAAVIAASVFTGCRKTSDAGEPNYGWPDTLRVATLYSPTSYFIYRDEPMGYDYSMVERLAHDKGLVLDLTVATSLQNLVELLDSNRVDLIAYEIPVTAEYRRRVMACGPTSSNHQVLVQPKRRNGSDTIFISDETQLVGRDIYVEGGSKYQYRLQNLNNELGGGINIHIIDRDTLITEDLIDMVSDGLIPLTVVDSDIARINQTYYHDIDASLPLSFPQKAAWGVSPQNPWLADSINAWMEVEGSQRENARQLKRYFELSKIDDEGAGGFSSNPFAHKNGALSPYDDIFRKYARQAGIDWRLMAAQGWQESHFDSSRVSWAGARGIMQIMPRTARAYGLPEGRIAVPEDNIATAAKILKDLDRSLSSKVPDSHERLKFVVAAYNSGIAHIYDAIALAAKYGRDPQRWDANVEQALLMKANPEYYSDPVCRAGYFRGRQTVAYVRHVFDLYNQALHHSPA